MQEYSQRFTREYPPELWWELGLTESTEHGEGKLLSTIFFLLYISVHLGGSIEQTKKIYLSELLYKKNIPPDGQIGLKAGQSAWYPALTEPLILAPEPDTKLEF